MRPWLYIAAAGNAVQTVQHAFGTIGKNVESASLVDADVAQPAETILEEMLLAESAILSDGNFTSICPARELIHSTSCVGSASSASPDGAMEIGTQVRTGCSSPACELPVPIGRPE